MALSLGQAGFQPGEIVDQFFRAAVAGQGIGGALRFRMRDGGVELARHAGEKLAKDFAGIAVPDRLRAGAGGQLALQRRLEFGQRRQAVLCHAEGLREAPQFRPVAPQASEAAGKKRVTGGFQCDERVAVPVAADPGAEADQFRCRQAVIGEVTLQGGVQLFGQGGHGVEQAVLEEVQAPGDFLNDGGLFQANFAGQPQEFDFDPQIVAQRIVLLGSGPQGLEGRQPTVHPAVNFQDRNPLGLGRMGGDHRLHGGRLEQGLEMRRIDSRRRRLGQGMSEGAGHRIGPADGFGMPPLARGGGFFGDGQQLKPDAMGLQDQPQLVAGNVVGPGPAGQGFFDTRCAQAQDR